MPHCSAKKSRFYFNVQGHRPRSQEIDGSKTMAIKEQQSTTCMMLRRTRRIGSIAASDVMLEAQGKLRRFFVSANEQFTGTDCLELIVVFRRRPDLATANDCAPDEVGLAFSDPSSTSNPKPLLRRPARQAQTGCRVYPRKQTRV